MAQGKLKVKNKVPGKTKNKNDKGPAATRRPNAPIKPKKQGNQQARKMKAMVSKMVNKKVEDEIRSRSLDNKKSLSAAQEHVKRHNAK